jgi:hypothetical protein
VIGRPAAAIAVAVPVAALAILGAAPGAAAPVEYDVRLPRTASLEPGEQRSLSLTITPRSGYTISTEGPLSVKLTVEPERGLALPRRRYSRKDAADARAEAPRFDLRARAIDPGSYRVAVDLRFWVCARRTCRPVSERREIEVEVMPPPPVPPQDEPAPGAQLGS